MITVGTLAAAGSISRRVRRMETTRKRLAGGGGLMNTLSTMLVNKVTENRGRNSFRDRSSTDPGRPG